MITYVNTVFVENATAGSDQFVIVDAETMDEVTETSNAIMIGQMNGTTKDMKGNTIDNIRWSNPIQKDAVKAFVAGEHTEDTPEAVVVDFSNVEVNADYRYVLRITYKDLPTRFRKWTESYEVSAVESAEDLANAFAEQISSYKNAKRARVEVSVDDAALTLTALPYDDDNSVDENINVAGQVRFSVNAWMTKPEADGFASKNKYSINGLSITKTPGYQYPASAKLVRDREYQAMGYLGILNRGEGTWPIIKPKMNTVLDGEYDYIIVEFENMYRTADDLHRKTKQTVEIYATTDTLSPVAEALITFVGHDPIIKA